MADTESGLLATSANYQLLVTKIFQPLNDRQISLILQTIAKRIFCYAEIFRQAESQKHRDWTLP